MTEKEAYIYSFLNSKSSTLSFYVPKILNTQTAKSELYGYIERVLSLINEVMQLLDSLSVDKIPVNKFFNELYLLKDTEIFEVRSILQKYDYENLLKKEYLDVVEKINEKKHLLPEDQICIEFFVNNHLLKDVAVFEFFIRGALVRECDLDYATFENLFVDYTKLRMGEYVKNPQCKVVPSKKLKGRKAYSSQDRMYLCREEIQKLHALGIYAVIKDMLHELTHIKQYKEIHIDHKADDFIIKQIKEEILSSYYPEYYNVNYAKISYEMEAEATAITELLKLFASFQIRFKNNENPYIGVLNNLISGINDNNRETRDGIQTVTELFDTVIMYHPDLLEIYPQLKTEYEIGYDDLVVRKDDFGRKD